MACLFSVILTACSDGTFQSSNSTMKFKIIKTSSGVTNLTGFKNSGIFTCETAGEYMILVYLKLLFKYTSQSTLYKNKSVLTYVSFQYDFIEYEHGTLVTYISLITGDNVYINTAFNKNNPVYTMEPESCMTILKVWGIIE